jgi:hypothetical protein
MTPHRSFPRRLLREPLVQFALLGLGLFAIYRFSGGGKDIERAEQVVVDAEQIERIASEFQRVWMRPPTEVELEGLIDDHVKEEILYREALALGLDRDDLIVRRRMRQKMEFLNEALVEEREPTDAELQAYLAEHADDFRRRGGVSFVQAFVSPDRHEDPEARAEQVLARLTAAANPDPVAEALGDASLLPTHLSASLDEVDRTFGEPFASQLTGAPLGEWVGPIESAYGLHLVRVDALESDRVPSLDEIRSDVERDWRYELQKKADAAFFEALLERYDVRIEPRAGPEPGAQAAEDGS